MKDEFKLYNEALEAWGEEPQIIKTMEECAELIHACSRYLIEKDWKTENAIKLINECIDVQLMLNQIQYSIFSDHQILFIEGKMKALESLDKRLRRLESRRTWKKNNVKRIIWRTIR